MTDEVRFLMHFDESFQHIVKRCLAEVELVDQFCRLSKVALPRPPRSGIEAMVDEATGYRDSQYKAFFEAFIPFVHRAVYLPMVAEFEKHSSQQPVKPKRGGGF
ncbi:hypothetical protein H0516_07725 [Pantoea stewartii]|nr:hypothetical protein [Pantoea stewartii]